MSSDRVSEAFFSRATQYYVTGRFGVLAGQIPVAGNLLHHAIEMYLKGGLAKTMTLKQLKGLSHNLANLWTTFKARFPSTSLASFDTVVSSLNTFEELRYPDSVLAKGMAVTFGTTRVAGTGSGIMPKPVPEYALYLEEIDALVDELFQVASVNPLFFVRGLTTRAREYLRDGNVQPWAG